MSDGLEIIDDPCLQSESVVELLGIDYPGTISEHTTLSFHRTRNGEDRVSDFGLTTMILQKESRRIRKSRETGYIKAFHWA
jgi:hypothetical protein